MHCLTGSVHDVVTLQTIFCSFVFVADGGDSFPTGWFARDLPDPIVFSDLTSTADGKTLLLTHPNSQSTRRNVSLFASVDGGCGP